MRFLGALFVLYGIGTACWGLMLVVPFFVASPEGMAKSDAVVSTHAQWLLPPALVVLGLFRIAAGIGLLLRTAWGRPVATLMMLVSQLFPLEGTIFGLVALWILDRSTAADPISEAAAPSASA